MTFLPSARALTSLGEVRYGWTAGEVNRRFNCHPLPPRPCAVHQPHLAALRVPGALGTRMTIDELRAALLQYADARLTVDLVPQPLWGKSLANTLPRAEWDRLRRWAYEKADNHCDVCGGRGPPRHPLECDEEWDYDDKASVQRLVGLRALCPDCHAVKHLGRSFKVGRGESALAHLSRVNRWDQQRVAQYVTLVKSLWKLRSTQPWQQDCSLLKTLRIP